MHDPLRHAAQLKKYTARVGVLLRPEPCSIERLDDLLCKLVIYVNSLLSIAHIRFSLPFLA
jgi:hypothetical protein